MKKTFSEKLVRPAGTGTWTFVPVPPSVSAAFETKGRVPVTGTIQTVPFRGAMMPDGYASWVSEAKKPETRVARDEQARGKLLEGKRLKG